MVFEEIQGLVPGYHVRIECGPDSCTWTCKIGEWSNIDPTVWFAHGEGKTIEEAGRNALLSFTKVSNRIAQP